MTAVNAGTRIGPFEIVKQISDGGMAIIFLAKLAQEFIAENPPRLTHRYPEQVVLKLQRTETEGKKDDKDTGLGHFYLNRLDAEVEMLVRLNENLNAREDALSQRARWHIVQILNIPTSIDRQVYIARADTLPEQPWYCALEYLEGGSLEATLKKKSKLGLQDGVALTRQVAAALYFLHAVEKIAHLDLKPTNIIFRKPYTPGKPFEAVLIDFGIARREGQRRVEAGSLIYTAPERLELFKQLASAEAAPDHPSEHAASGDQTKADVYALGIVMYKALTGRVPFWGRDRASTTTAILSKEPVPPSYFDKTLPSEVEAVILQALEKDPAKRPTILQFGQGLERLSANLDLPVSAPPRERTTLNKVLAPVIGGVAVLGIIGGFFALGPLGLLNAFNPTSAPASPIVATPVPAQTDAPTGTLVIAAPTETDSVASSPTTATTTATAPPTQVITKQATSTRAPTRTPTNTPRPTNTPTWTVTSEFTPTPEATVPSPTEKPEKPTKSSSGGGGEKTPSGDKTPSKNPTDPGK
ncbi:MAG: protein kinase [Chloroflexi bacterium]|nr:protein kinase [Chloroflexota bacterium]